MAGPRRTDPISRVWRALDIPANTRRSLTWCVGMALGTWETLHQHSPRAAVYAFAAGLIGTPEVVARARRIGTGKTDQIDEEGTDDDRATDAL